jgi:hypothetical protein
LNNNRTGLIEGLTERLPQIVLTPFYPLIPNLTNEELSVYLTGFLRIGNNLKIAIDKKFEYNILADNETTTNEVFEYIKDINNDTSTTSIQDYINGLQPKSMEWLQSIGDFFGGSTEPSTTTTTETTEKTNWLLVLSIMAGLVGFAFLVFKFYRKSPVAKK